MFILFELECLVVGALLGCPHPLDRELLLDKEQLESQWPTKVEILAMSVDVGGGKHGVELIMLLEPHLMSEKVMTKGGHS